PLVGDGIGGVVHDRFKSDGESAHTVPDDIPKIIDALRAGKDVSLDGTVTTGLFAPAGHVVFMDQTMWCLDPHKNKIDRLIDSGLTYRTDQPTVLAGTLTCF